MRKIIKIMLILSLISAVSAAPALADNLVVAAGAGYKAYVTELTNEYTSQTGNRVDLIFGNMAHVIAQAKAGGKADVALGAEWFFSEAGLDLGSCLTVGEGKLVLAWTKGVSYAGTDGLQSPDVKRIAMPDPKRAIYGRAAMQYLESTGLKEELQDKLLIVGTIPQVGAYLMAGETDFGFINLTHARMIASKIGGNVELTEGYIPIHIVVCPTKNIAPGEMDGFLRFIKTDAAKAIAVKHGLESLRDDRSE